MDDEILVEARDGWRKIVLNRPDRLNAFNDAMHRKLGAALTEIASDHSVRAILITGAGRGFCAGQDLSDRKPKDGAPPPDLGATLENFYNPLIRALRGLPKPVVCAVNGVAAGAGANIAFACDIVLAARSAKFIQSFSRIGLVPDSGGTYFLPRLAGTARANALAMLGEPVTSEQAESWGLIWKSLPDEALGGEAEVLTERLSQQPTAGLAMIKEALAASLSNNLDAQLDLECDLQRRAGKTADYAEGVRAFFDKRAPAFQGR
jgi:2-(1,2-epoxy-1,2-dihydrophenyl)acetyl-CoA isomerase